METELYSSEMLHEARDAPARIAQLLAADENVYHKLVQRLVELNPAGVVTIARGSSDHAATYANYLFTLETGRIVASLAPSLITVLGAQPDLRNQFVLTISQSGRSPDIIQTQSSAHKTAAVTAAIVNDTASPVANGVDFLLPQHAGREGIAATKTVLCTLTAIARLAAQWSQDQKLVNAVKELPRILDEAYRAGLDLNVEILEGIRNAYVLSRGLGLAAALEISLKLKETCGIHAEAFSTAEVRHGPREIVDDNFLVIALAIPSSGRDDVLATAQELKGQGAKVMTIDLGSVPDAGDFRLSPLVVLQLLYPWLARSSKALGFDPDRPRTLKSKVIETT